MSGIEAEIKELLRQVTAAYEQKDVEALMARVAPEAEVVFIGTGADERLVGWQSIKAAYERDFAQSDSIDLDYTWIKVGARGDVAWFVAEGRVEVGTAQGSVSQTPRWSGVL